MSSRTSSIALAPHRRRQLAAVLLRGNLDAYDVHSAMAGIVDRMVDQLVEDALRAQPQLSCDAAAQRVIDQYAYRTAGKSCGQSESREAAYLAAIGDRVLRSMVPQACLRHAA